MIKKKDKKKISVIGRKLASEMGVLIKIMLKI